MFSIKVPFEIGEVMDYSVCLVFAYDFFPLVTNERELLFSCAFLFYFFDSSWSDEVESWGKTEDTVGVLYAGPWEAV